MHRGPILALPVFSSPITSGMQNGAEAIDALNCQIASSAFASEGAMSCAVPVLYLILRFLEDLAVSGGSDPA